MTHSISKYIKGITLITLVFNSLLTFAQNSSMSQEEAVKSMSKADKKKDDFIRPDVRTWVLRHEFTFSDTVAVDTLSTGYQNYNPIYKESISNTHLGNYGSPYVSNIFYDRKKYDGFMFYNTLLTYIPQPENINFYNTKTPYINLTYHSGSPKSRSEEAVKVLYAQNINKYWNIGAGYDLNSSIGQLESIKSENQNFRFFTSYNGINYNLHAAFIYAKIKNFENGGVNRNDLPTNQIDYNTPNDLPVNLQNATNTVRSRKLFFNQSLAVGHISRMDTDSVVIKIPVTTVNHTLNLEEGYRIFAIDEIAPFYTTEDANPFFPHIYGDSLQTRDTSKIYRISNTFQLKFNEEANKFLKFGLRAYFQNNILNYKYQEKPFRPDSDTDFSLRYRQGETTLVTSAVGGQIFKNTGENFWWNAGAKVYIQGYKAGDSEFTGKLNSSFKILNDTAGFFANGGIFLEEPEFFENNYYSNHAQWTNDFRKEKTVKINGGFRIPTKRFELFGGTHLINDHIYWGNDIQLAQSSKVLQVYYATLKQHFKLGNIHSRHQFTYQISSDQSIIPLPDISYYTSNYYQNTLFQVLHFQLGFDVRYNSAFYAQAYDPASGQFYNQNNEKMGDFPKTDVFLNLQLKRARVYLMYADLNRNFINTSTHNAYLYPGNISTIKFGVSWNFYD